MSIPDLAPPVKSDKPETNWSILSNWFYLLWKFVRTPALVGIPTSTTGNTGDLTNQIATDSFAISSALMMAGGDGVLTDFPGVYIDNFSPIVTASSGTITTATATMRYKILGKTAFFSLNISITTNGTGAGFVIASLPFTPVMTTSAVRQIVAGRDNFTSKMLQGLTVGASGLFIAFYDGTYPGANGAMLYLTGSVEII